MQTSFFTDDKSFPHSYADLRALFDRYLARENEDADAFTWSDLSTDGRSYSFYGQKVFEFYPDDAGKAKIKLPGRIMKQLGYGKADAQDEAYYILPEKAATASMLEQLIEILRQEKKTIFRNTITEKFGCCHAFKECSNKGECLFQDDRFYNGCEYRKNLEAGRNFYKNPPAIGEHKPFTSIVGLDFETANANRSSACAVAAVRYDISGEKKKEYYTLINPHEEFDFFNIMIHGITPEMVKDSPDIHEAMKAIFDMLEPGTLIVCHNAAFDMSVLRASLAKNPLAIPDFTFTCTYRLSSRVLPKNISYTLPDVAEQCGIVDLEHHEALSDADVCARILFYLIGLFDGDIDRLHQTANIDYGYFRNGEYEGIHRATRESLGRKEAEKHNLPSFTVGPESPFYGKVVAFTGKLESMTREEAISIINQIGGTGAETLTQKTNILVTGYQDPSKLRGKEKSSKRLAAEKMLNEGKDIEIIPEEQFYRML